MRGRNPSKTKTKNQKETYKMTPEITNLLAESKMSPTMVAEQIDIMTDDSAAAITALKAIAKAESNPTPTNNLAAHNASVSWIESNINGAINILKTRIAVRAVRGITE
jgi:hypothetical protein